MFVRKIAILLFFTLAGMQVMALQISSEQRRRGHRVRKAPFEVIQTTIRDSNVPIEVSVEKGTSHNHPLMAIWIEDLQGNYIQTLYVAQSIALGKFAYGDASTGKWMPGPIQRPASLPYWAHKRGVQSETGLFVPSQKHPMPDAVTGPTPKSNFLLKSQVPLNVPDSFVVLLEINQSWDWNMHWTNNKFPNDMEYFSSSQPAVVYRAAIKNQRGSKEMQLMPIGHSHWSGATGELFSDLSTITTALQIIRRATVRIPE